MANDKRRHSSIVVDGIMFTSGPWSVVFAHDAKTGELLWQYDPQVPKEWGRYACCDVVNRGVAVWKGKVYFGTIDGRLIALDARTGKLVWDTKIADFKRRESVSAGPLVELSDLAHPRIGGSIGLWGFVGVTPFARVGLVNDLGGFAEIGVHIALPVLRR